MKLARLKLTLNHWKQGVQMNASKATAQFKEPSKFLKNYLSSLVPLRNARFYTSTLKTLVFIIFVNIWISFESVVSLWGALKKFNIFCEKCSAFDSGLEKLRARYRSSPLGRTKNLRHARFLTLVHVTLWKRLNFILNEANPLSIDLTNFTNPSLLIHCPLYHSPLLQLGTGVYIRIIHWKKSPQENVISQKVISSKVKVSILENISELR